jgi:hypothetical protein
MTRSTRPAAATSVLVGLLSFAVYWRTAYPTITWWDSGNYSISAATLGVNSPPGSLLLTLLGWLATRLPTGGEPARILNLLAALIAATTVAVTCLLAIRIVQRITLPHEPPSAAVVAAGAGALALAFAATQWEHAIKFTPYGLSALFTALILLALLRWWDVAETPAGWRWLAVVALLFGLDFSVHRTNALLMPGALAWVLVRHPATLRTWRAWAAAAGGMIVGLSAHLMIIPIARHTASPVNMFEPTTWRAFRDYVSIASRGGNFLVDLWPRKSPLWGNQVADFMQVFRDNFAHDAPAVAAAGWLPLLGGIAGLIALWRRRPRLGLAFSLVVVLHAAATIAYFNIPSDYFRPFDRHYLPVLVTFAVAIAVGSALLVRAATRSRLAPVASLAVLALPLVQLSAGWTGHDASRRHFTRDFAGNLLHGLPPRTILFVAGDNDTYPLWYAQSVEGVRPDVRVVNLSLANVEWYVGQLRQQHPDIPLTVDPEQRKQANAAAWRDRFLRVATAEGGSVEFHPVQSGGGGGAPTAADELFMDLVRTNGFRDPVAFSWTVGTSGLAWLADFARRDGLHWLIVPQENPVDESAVLRASLAENEYRGFADEEVTLDRETQIIGFGYVSALQALLAADMREGNPEQCRVDLARFLDLVPLDRFALVPATTRRQIETACAN